MTGEIQTRNRRFTLKGWHLVLVVLLVLAGLLGAYIMVHRGATERRLAALRAAGYPTSLAELAEYTKLPEGVPNAAEVYAQAFAAFVRPVDEANVPVLGKAKWPDRGTPPPEPMAKAISECLAANQKCLALLHDAAGIEHCRYDWDYRQMPLPRQDSRYGAQLLNVSAIYHAGQGDAETAVTCILDGLRFGDSLRREPALVGYLVRIACISLALGGLERSLSLTAFTDEQLQGLGEALTRTGDTLDLAPAMITERCFMIEMCRNPALWGPPGQSIRVRTFPGLSGIWLADILDYMEDCVEAAKPPPGERLRQFRRIDSEIRQLSFIHVMTKVATPALTRVAELDVRVRAHLELARAALAMERYRQATGKAPGQLEELVPQYLEQVPTDPFDGQPIRYQHASPGYLLYSVDTDGQDHGGRERSEKDRGAPYDLCFTVAR